MILEQHQSWSPSRVVFRRALDLVFKHAKQIAILWFGFIALGIVFVFAVMTVPAGWFWQTMVLGVLTALFAIYKLSMSACQLFLAADLKTRSVVQIAHESVLPRLPALIALNILVTVATFVGVFAGIIPGVVLFIFWSMASAVLLLEQTSVRDALKGSVRLVRGWWWPMLHRHLFWLSVITLQTLISLVPVVGVFVSAVASLILLPAGVFFFYLTYKELVDVKQFPHMQVAHTTLTGKALLLVWGLALFAAFVFVSSAELFVRSIIWQSPAFLPQKSDATFLPQGVTNAPERLFAPKAN